MSRSAGSVFKYGDYERKMKEVEEGIEGEREFQLGKSSTKGVEEKMNTKLEKSMSKIE